MPSLGQKKLIFRMNPKSRDDFLEKVNLETNQFCFFL